MNKKIAFVLLLLLFNNGYCQLGISDNTIPIVSIKYPPLLEIISQVLVDEQSKNYFSDSLNFMITYVDTLFPRNIWMDTNPSYYIVSGVPVYLFVISPCPEGIPTLEDSTFCLLKYKTHYFYLINYDTEGCDTVLFTHPYYYINRKRILQIEAFEDDRWPEYFFYSSTDSSGRNFWRKK